MPVENKKEVVLYGKPYVLRAESKGMVDIDTFMSWGGLCAGVKDAKRKGAHTLVIRRYGDTIRTIKLGSERFKPYTSINIELMRIPKQDLLEQVVQGLNKAASYMNCEEGVDAILVSKDAVINAMEKATDDDIIKEYKGLLSYMRPHTYLMIYDKTSYE